MADQRLELIRSNMMDTSGVEEKVEVNQRHLIDKILARYSAEYVLYRELMQNADDASSSSVQIMFHSSDSAIDTKAPNLSTKCNRITFKNNGMPFRPEDWNRLKRIAEGNPDEQKIGAFGVGFYSLFSVCENPFVFSGSQCMAFYFKGDQLFAKRADVPDTQVDNWTSFLMDLREPMEMPDLDDFAKFLTTSMGFTANLRQISVYFDQHKIFEIIKKTAEPRAMVVDPNRLHTVTPKRMFSITGVDMRKLQLDAEKYTPPTMFTPFANLISLSNSKPRESGQGSGLSMEKSSIFLSVITAALSVNVPRDFEKEMERATKKKPPKTTKFQLVYTGKEELDASESNNKIFKDLMPFPHQGRVFIGFPTHQTTGCCSHMAARFIPTVERESIDFADRYISVWNRELLAAGGLLSRLVYDDEMDQVARFYKELVGYTDIVDKTKRDEGMDSAKRMLEDRAGHALRSFTFRHSTPSPIVGKEHGERFYNSSKVPPQIMTSHGIQSVTAVRTIPEHSFGSQGVGDLLDAFVKTVPTLTLSFMKDCREALSKLVGLGLLQPLRIADILKELNTRALNEDEMIACMKWWVECNKKNPSMPSSLLEGIDATVKNRFLDAAILNMGDRLLTLSTARWWVNPKVIPLDVQHPETTLPFNITKNFVGPDLGAYFGDLKELPVLEWVRFISTKNQLVESPVFAEQVLAIASRGFQHSSASTQSAISLILQDKACIPTKYGMKLPKEAYFTSVNLFDDLPIVGFKAPRTISDQFLSSLGVRKHVELQMVFDRLVSEGSWSHIELVKYLTSVQTTLSSVELVRLKASQIFTKEGEEPKVKEFIRNTGRVDENGKPIGEKYKKSVYRRYKASDLYAPVEALRNLNLPLIQWDNRWRPSSEEAKFLEKLGLQIKPVLSDLLTLASPATDNQYLQNKALGYFVDNYAQYNSEYIPSRIDIDFVPCLGGKTYTSPKNCFTNPEVQILGFHALHPDLIPVREKLGVMENPDAERLVSAFLQNVSQEHGEVKRMFEYMASRMGDLGYPHWQRLRQAKFVPVFDKRNENDKTKTSKITMLIVEPTQCYFESEESNFHKELFLYVNFGQLANSFLRSCGVKDEPTTIELAAMLVKDPQRFWDLSGGGERYLTVLRQIAGQYYQIRSQRTLIAEMKSTAFLVGLKRSNMNDKLSTDEDKENNDAFDGEKEDFVQYRLAKASDIFISDDTMGQQIFSPLSAPMEPLLEEFYANLGSTHLSKNIKESYTFRDAVGTTSRSKAIAEAILERTPIIIYQMMNDNPQRQKELLHDEVYVKRNLKVIQAKELKMLRLFKHTGEKHVQSTTACADRSSFTVYISGAGEIDFYDVSNALCTLLFARVRFNDAIIVERYLTASLNNLRRKGVPVDRILNIRKNIEKAQTPELTKNQMVPQERISPQEMDMYTKQVMDVFSDCQEGYIRQLLSQQRENHVENVINQLLQEDYPRKQPLKAQSEENVLPPTAIQPKPSESKRSTKLLDRIWSPWSKPSPPQPPMETKPVETIQPPEPPQKPKLPKSETTITPNYTNNIKENLKRGIHSCKPYSDQTVFSPPRINKVTESNSYCDTTPGQNLTYVGNIAGMDFYIHRGINAEDVLEQHGQAMSRFTSISGVLSSVFNLKKSSVHIFYDTEGPTIAFNTNGSLFLNLRYYLALHEPGATEDLQLVKNKRKEALIYWFMTYCHELAHNFVSEHSSEHEFYMSSFAEVYLDAFIAHLNSSNTPTIGDQE
ncbi:hypothetical protein CLU79DRAFT_882880 [Phycomyces nitens]|nr:hypothetical protein CLU79DRAFT_882880 [Phycomyces nitens]